jgi:hypothetical protein
MSPCGPRGDTREEKTMNKVDRPDAKEKAKWALGATGILLAYFGAFAVLMFPVIIAGGGA